MKVLDIFSCPICEKVRGLDKHFKCTECSFKGQRFENIVSLVPSQEEHFKQISKAAKGKQSWYEDEQEPALIGPYRHHLGKRRRYLSHVLQSFIEKRQGNLVGLDLGCGDGSNIAFLKKYADLLYACDYNLLRLKRAKKYIDERMPLLFQADLLKFPVKEKIFDFIFFNHVLEHIPNDKEALKSVKQVLKPNGLLILGVPNEGAFFWQLAYKLQPRLKEITDHKHFYTVASLQNLLFDSGFSIKETKHIGYGVPHFRLDEILRSYKIFDDLLEFTLSRICPHQSSSIYMICKHAS